MLIDERWRGAMEREVEAHTAEQRRLFRDYVRIMAPIGIAVMGLGIWLGATVSPFIVAAPMLVGGFALYSIWDIRKTTEGNIRTFPQRIGL